MKNAALVLVLALGLVSCDGTRSEAPQPATAATSAGSVTLGGKKIDVAMILAEKDRRHAVARLAPATETQGHLLAWPRDRFIKVESDHSRAAFDVLFLDKAGKIVDQKFLAANSDEGVMPKAPAAYALLLLPGLPGKLGLKDGDAAALSPEVQAAKPEELTLMTINGVKAWVELALTNDERQHGLMHRPRMSQDDGMLFAYPEEGNHQFWMMNTFIPLDIAFFAADGTLLNVNETAMYPDPRNPGNNYATANSKGQARFVLEMNLGWFRAKGLVDGSGHVAPGTKGVIPDWAAKGSTDY